MTYEERKKSVSNMRKFAVVSIVLGLVALGCMVAWSPPTVHRMLWWEAVLTFPGIGALFAGGLALALAEDVENVNEGRFDDEIIW